MSRIEVKIKMPDELKPWLVDDWDLITRQKMVILFTTRRTSERVMVIEYSQHLIAEFDWNNSV